MTAAPFLVVYGLGDNGEGEVVPLAEVLRDNCDDGDLCAALAALPAGGVLVVGGGAAPQVLIVRLSRKCQASRKSRTA